MIFMPGSVPWKYVKAEPPCWKGEVQISFWLFGVAIGWKRDRVASE